MDDNLVWESVADVGSFRAQCILRVCVHFIHSFAAELWWSHELIFISYKLYVSLFIIRYSIVIIIIIHCYDYVYTVHTCPFASLFFIMPLHCVHEICREWRVLWVTRIESICFLFISIFMFEIAIVFISFGSIVGYAVWITALRIDSIFTWDLVKWRRERKKKNSNTEPKNQNGKHINRKTGRYWNWCRWLKQRWACIRFRSPLYSFKVINFTVKFKLKISGLLYLFIASIG